MGKVLEFEQRQEPAIQIERTDEFHSAAKKLSDFVTGLAITRQDNNTLVALMIEQVRVAERGAFLQGFSMGIEIMNFEE